MILRTLTQPPSSLHFMPSFPNQTNAGAPTLPTFFGKGGRNKCQPAVAFLSAIPEGNLLLPLPLLFLLSFPQGICFLSFQIHIPKNNPCNVLVD
jgi:hypothetical protein